MNVFSLGRAGIALCAVSTVFSQAAIASDIDTPPHEKRIIADFEDMGTWRGGGPKAAPGTWFAADMFLGGSTAEKRNGNAVGELRFTTDPNAAPPWTFSFSRVKVSLLTATPDGIEFDANPKGRVVAFSFVLRDAKRRDFTTTAVAVDGNGWRSVRLDLGPKTVPGWAGIVFPVSLQRLVMSTDQPGNGSVFLDDLAFTGRFPKSEQLAVRPVYDGIAYDPRKPVALTYRIYNARPETLPVTVSARVNTAEGAFVVEKSMPSLLPALGDAVVTLSPGMLPVGAYQVDVSVRTTGDAMKLDASYDDTFGVFTPNGGRVNTHGMEMGVQDLSVWKSEGGRGLNVAWAKALGSDAERLVGGAGRLEYKDGRWALGGWDTLLKEYQAAGIDVLFTYFELPSWMASNPKDSRTPPRDYARFERHAAEFGKFIAGYPGVKYVEFWNEPDSGGPGSNHGFFHGTKEDYLKMFETFCRGFRTTNQTTKLTTGGVTLGDEIAGLSRATITDPAADYDLVSFHAHGSQENYEARETKVEGWMAEAGIKKGIVNSEAGERSGYTRAGRFSQAVTLVKKIAYAKSRPSSELYLWFTLQDYWDMDPEADDSFGLVTSDCRAKPSFVAYNELIRQLANTDPAGEVELNPSVRTLRFRRDDGSFVYVCWLRQGAGANLWLRSGGARVTVTDLFGRNSIAPAFDGMSVVSLGAGPVYLSTGVKGTEFTEVPGREVFLQVPGAIVSDGGAATTLPVSFTDPEGKAASGSFTLSGADEEMPNGAPFTLAAGKACSMEIPVAAALAGNRQSGRRLTLTAKWDAGGSENTLSLPIQVIDAYPLRRFAKGNPFSASQESFIEKLPVITLDQQSDVMDLVFDPSVRPWQGPRDLSARARLAHDDKGIYLRFDVTDDKHVQTSFPARLDRGDSVQVAVAGQGGVTLFSLGLLDSGEQVIWCDRGPDKNLTGRWDTPLRITPFPGGLRYEAYVPFDHLGIDFGKGGETLRFSFIVNEDDGQRPDRWQRRVRYLRWQNGTSTEPERLGYGILE